MKKLSLATVIALGLGLPMAALADDDVTIRVMEMHEMSSDAVMQEIQLPEAASDQASDIGQPGHRARERVREHAGEGDELMMHEGEMEQMREMEQERERIMEEQHEHAQQTEPADLPESPMMDGHQSGMGGNN